MTTDRDLLRVLTLNLWHTPTDLDRRLDAAAAEIRDRAPDVVCLQEVGFDTDRRPGAADVLAARTGLPVAAAGGDAVRGALGERSGLAVLTRLPVTDTQTLELPTSGSTHSGPAPSDAAVVVEATTPAGRPLLVATTHLAWGGRREHVRLRQAQHLDRYLADHPATGRGAVVVWTGDFNTVPHADTLRFLTGLAASDDGGAYWTDAWAAVGDGDGYTSGPDNPWAADTARQVGITRPEFLPQRRIDYVLVRDFAYGRPGSPTAARLACTAPHPDDAGVVASDHWGVEVDLWDPPTAT